MNGPLLSQIDNFVFWCFVYLYFCYRLIGSIFTVSFLQSSPCRQKPTVPTTAPLHWISRHHLQNMTPAQLLAIAENEINQNKQAIITNRMNETFLDKLAPLSRRIRNQPKTMIAKARFTFLYYHKCCPLHREMIKGPAMQLWVNNNLGRGVRRQIFTPEGCRKIMDASMELDVNKIA